MPKSHKTRRPMRPGKQYIFRVLRPTVDGQPAVLLEPMTDEMTAHLEEGNEFITGTLNSNPFKAPEFTLVNDDAPEGGLDSNRRRG